MVVNACLLEVSCFIVKSILCSATVCFCFSYAFAWLFLDRVKKVSFHGRHVVLTGGTLGIGYAMAERIVLAGGKLTICARNAKRLDEIAEKLNQMVGEKRVYTFTLDVSRTAAEFERVNKELDAAEKFHKRSVDMLINNAGKSHNAIMDDLTFEIYQAQIDLHFTSSVAFTKAVLPRMLNSKNSARRIMFVSSMAGLTGFLGRTAYSPSKFTLKGFAESLLMEYRTRGLRVTVCYPPGTSTEGLDIEFEIMPAVQRQMAMGAKLYSADDVATSALNDICEGNFTSTTGIEGWLLSSGTAGLAPPNNPLHFALQTVVGGVGKLAALFYLKKFYRGIEKAQNEEGIQSVI